MYECKTGMTARDIEETLEGLIDSTSLTEVVKALVEVCELKAQHLQENWQDVKASNAWMKDAATIDRIISKLVW